MSKKDLANPACSDEQERLANPACSELELGAFMGIEMKRGLTAKGLRQAEVEYYLWAGCSMFPFVQIITDMQVGGAAFYRIGSSPAGLASGSIGTHPAASLFRYCAKTACHQNTKARCGVQGSILLLLFYVFFVNQASITWYDLSSPHIQML